MTGCPIRKSPGQGLFAPNRSLSQLITSFIASESQGIHRLHLTFSLMSYMPTFRHCCLKANILTRALDCLKPRGFSICNRFVSECQRSLLCHSMRSDYAMLTDNFVRPDKLNQSLKQTLRCGMLTSACAFVDNALALLTKLTLSSTCSKKELFQPHLPVRLPCYDLAPITRFALGRSSRLRTSGAPGFHGLTGGVYKARERIHRAMADARLLANPASWSRVPDSNPN